MPCPVVLLAREIKTAEILNHFGGDLVQESNFFLFRDRSRKLRRGAYDASRKSDGEAAFRDRPPHQRICADHSAVTNLRARQNEHTPGDGNASTNFDGIEIHRITFEFAQ